MNTKGIKGYIYRITELVTQFAFLQLLWIVFTILGLGIFGIFPSTAAMFSVVRKWVMGVEDAPVFKTFWQTYKTEFIRVNGLGLIFVAMGWLLYVDFHFFTIGDSMGSSILKMVTILITYFFITTAIYFFPIFVHFQYRFFGYLKYSFLYSVSSPLRTAGIFIITCAIYFLLLKVPSLFLIFSGSIISYIWMWYVYSTITKTQATKKG